MVALLDQAGVPRPGWPITLPAATSCGQLLPVADGSVRVVCAPSDLNQDLNNGVRAFAFDVTGRPLAGWPVEIVGFYATARVIGTDLTFFTTRSLGDVEVEGQPSADGGLVTVSADGSVEHGVRVTRFDECCDWEIGADGVAYSASIVTVSEDGTEVRSRITAVDSSGLPSGWPVAFDGLASQPAFMPDGRIALTVSSLDLRTTRVIVLTRAGKDVAASSAELALVTGPDAVGETGGCPPDPPSPLVVPDGSIVIFSEADRPVIALDQALAVKAGWPYRPATPLVLRDERYVKVDAYCPYLAIPAIGPDGTLYLPLVATDGTAGGHLVALGPDGRERSGWPVTLTRSGSEFWSVVVGPCGTVYALAIEPEPGESSSATILAIAPDSTVIYATTIVDPRAVE